MKLVVQYALLPLLGYYLKFIACAVSGTNSAMSKKISSACI